MTRILTRLRPLRLLLTGGVTLLAGVQQSRADVTVGGDTTGLYLYDLEDFAALAGYPGDAFVMLENVTLGINFGEKLFGQTNTPESDFDVITGSPTVPLTMDTSIEALEGVNLLAYSGNTTIDGLAGVDLPFRTSIGNGALTVLFGGDQRAIGFDVVGSNGGRLDVQFFDRSGALLDYLTIVHATDGPYAFTSDATDIAAITVGNFDDYGLVLDNFRFGPTPSGGSSVCQAGGPYQAVSEGGVAEVPLSAGVPDVSDAEPWSYFWTTDCPGGSFDDETSPNAVLHVEASVACELECGVTLIVDDGARAVLCMAPVTVFGGTSITCPPDVTVECDGEGNSSELEEWLDSAGGDPDSMTDDFAGISWACGATGTAAVTWEVSPDQESDCGSPAECSATFTIEDTSFPVLNLDATLLEVVDTECLGDVVVTLPEATATDECDENPLVSHDAPDVFPAGQTTTVTYEAIDECGNTSTETVEVTVLYGATIEVEVVRHGAGRDRHHDDSDGDDSDDDSDVDDSDDDADDHEGRDDDRPPSEPLAGLEVSAYDRSRGSCAREQMRQKHGPRRAAEAVYLDCEPVATARTDADAIAILNVPPGKYMLVAAVDTDGDLEPDHYLHKTVGRLHCGDWKKHKLRFPPSHHDDE